MLCYSLAASNNRSTCYTNSGSIITLKVCPQTHLGGWEAFLEIQTTEAPQHVFREAQPLPSPGRNIAVGCLDEICTMCTY